MPQLFISHSSADNVTVTAFSEWLRSEGWDDIFLDIDPERGIAVGERWRNAIVDALNGSQAVIFLISRAWLGSKWCAEELALAQKLNKRIFGVLIEDIAVQSLPEAITSIWQVARLQAPGEHRDFETKTVDGATTLVSFSIDELARLKLGLARAGLDASFFPWPPEDDPERSPYPGLVSLGEADAGIFFGREASTISVLDELRGLHQGASPRIFVILGASGAGKSSFLRAGVCPRLSRDDSNFLPLPVIRPNRDALWGEAGLSESLSELNNARGFGFTAKEITRALETPEALQTLLTAFADRARPPAVPDEVNLRCPSVVIPVDQSEELFVAESAETAQRFMDLMGALVLSDAISVILLFTVRTDRYGPLQSAAGIASPLAGMHQHTFSLPPLPKGRLAQVIEGPALRLSASRRPLKLDPQLTQHLLTDLGSGDGKDALPLVAFTMERLYRVHGAAGVLTLEQYHSGGGLKGSIEAAIDKVLAAPDPAGMRPTLRADRLKLLRDAFIPWLAGVDPDTQAPRRRIALMSEIPQEAHWLVAALVEQRLLSTDVASRPRAAAEVTVEVAHEAVLRQWEAVRSWLNEERMDLNVLEGVARASEDWSQRLAAANNVDKDVSDDEWLQHRGFRLIEAERVFRRRAFSAAAGETAVRYLAACRDAQDAAAAEEKRRLEAEKQQITRTRRLQRRGFILLASAFIAVVIGAASVITVLQNLNQRRANTLAALARQSFNQGFADRAARYALSAMQGRGNWLIGFDASRAEDLLRIQHQNSGALGALRHDDQVRSALFSNDGTQVLTASFDGTAVLWNAVDGSLIRRFQGHNFKVETAIFSPNGRWIATTAFDGTARLWNSTTDGPQFLVLPHKAPGRRAVQVWKAAFSPDGSLLATAAGDGIARIWEVETGRLLGEFKRHGNVIRDIAFSPDGTRVLSASENGDARVWSAGTREEIAAFETPLGAKPGDARAVFIDDGRRIAVGFASGAVRIYDIATRTEVALSPAHSNFVRTLQQDPETGRLLTASGDGCARLWDLKTAKLLHSFTAPSEQECQATGVRAAAFTPTGEEIITVGDDETARIWDADNGALLFEYRGHTGRIWTVDVAPDGSRFVTAAADGEARIWDATIRQEALSITLKGHTGPVRSIAFSPDGRFVATGSYDPVDRTARVWNAVSGKLLATINAGQVQAVTFSPDGDFIATATTDTNAATVWLWRRCQPDGFTDCQTDEPMKHPIRVMDVEFSPDGKRLTTAARDNFARVWSLKDPSKPLAVFEHLSGASTSAFLARGSRVISGSYDDAYVWNAETGAEICQLAGHTASVRDAAVSPDGKLIATASEDETVRIWDAETCKERQRISVEGDSVWSVAFSPDSAEVVVGSQNFKSARVFDVATGVEVATLLGHDDAVFSAVFLPDGRIATASNDGTARLWSRPPRNDLEGDLLVRQVCDKRLAAGLSIFTDEETSAAPALDPDIDRNPCRPQGIWRRNFAIFSKQFN